MKVTTDPWCGNGRTHPPMWDVLIDGKPMGGGLHSIGRVLKMGRRYLPILDGGSVLANMGSYATRKEAAMAIVDDAKAEGLL